MEPLTLEAKLIVVHLDVIMKRNIRNSCCFNMELALKTKKNYHMVQQFYTGFMSTVDEIIILSRHLQTHIHCSNICTRYNMDSPKIQ